MAGEESSNNPCPDVPFGPEEEKKLSGDGEKCLYLHRNRRLLGQVGLVAVLRR